MAKYVDVQNAPRAGCDPSARARVYELDGHGPTLEHGNYVRLILPYQGLLNCRWAGGLVRVDANQVLFLYGDCALEPQAGVAWRGLAVTLPKSMSMPPLGHMPKVCRAEATTVLLTHEALRHSQQGTIPGAFVSLIDEHVQVLAPCLTAPGISPTLEAARDLMHERVVGRLTAMEIARALGVSRKHLSTAFTRVFGIALYHYEMRLRLNQALRMLPTGVPLTSLALTLGFSSHSHFTGAFRATFGVPPSQLRHAPLAGTVPMLAQSRTCLLSSQTSSADAPPDGYRFTRARN